MKLRIGRRSSHDVATLAEASAIYGRERDLSGEGGSTFPDGIITDGKVRYRVSYNGRIWEYDRDRFAKTTLVFESRRV
jgi:hypothetical protein